MVPDGQKFTRASMRSTVRRSFFVILVSLLLAFVAIPGSGCDGKTAVKAAPDAGLGVRDGDGLVDPDWKDAGSADALVPDGSGTTDSAIEGNSDTINAQDVATLDSGGGYDFGRTNRDTDVSLTVDGGDATVDVRVSTGDIETCDGSALNGVWLRSVDKLTMILATANGCAISGSADNGSYLHAIVGTYDSATRSMHGTIRRTNRSTGCVTMMTVTLMLTDTTHFTEAITGTDGRCDLLTTYNEAFVWVKQ
jgi:hypothetical protein